MPDFTPEQVQDARENPRVGDEWRKGTYMVEVLGVNPRWIDLMIGDGDMSDLAAIATGDFAGWIADATLVRRGNA